MCIRDRYMGKKAQIFNQSQKINREMVRAYNDVNMVQNIHQYLVTGRRIPKSESETPEVYAVRVFARDEIIAKSIFWGIMRRQNKLKKANGEVIAVNEIFENNTRAVKTYGIVLRYQSRTAIHNIYKEFRDVSLNGAMSQMFREMSGNHRVNPKTIQIIRTATLEKNEDIKRETVRQMRSAKLQFPLRRSRRAPLKKFRTTFRAVSTYKKNQKRKICFF
eukprot:TRINITY_DN32_c0_g1_i3.p1 TRINITY_DN32_c0_g1~~TRINITY_DN32_c0_g1_i3.p1  ORF type:complete len:219 (-),score=88.59 TRINITY_DN32_c0_g1_i3:333-989(-)